MPYINYVEFNVGDVAIARTFYKDVFDWDPKPLEGDDSGLDDYLVASHVNERGIDTGITTSPEGDPITVAVVTVDDIAGYMAKVIVAGGEIVVPRFTIPGVGEACYFTDTTGMVVGLHEPEGA
ncbi:MAG: hypothetical protein O3B42_01800 [Actinomycetota bacterium]|nr:hypothetical protein [Actinomycetota bacterium]